MRTLGRGLRGSTPYLVMLITVEPLELQLRHDRRFSKFVNQGYFVFYTVPLGWEDGAYVYHTTGLLATSYIIILAVHPIPHTSVIVV